MQQLKVTFSHLPKKQSSNAFLKPFRDGAVTIWFSKLFQELIALIDKKIESCSSGSMGLMKLVHVTSCEEKI